MLELSGNVLTFNFPHVHPAAVVRIGFQRTLRIPDDDKTYPLPPNLNSFPVRHVEDFKKRLPSKWLKRGGVMLPMYQSEAMWLLFHGQYDSERQTTYPFAIKVATGKMSALTGKPWSKKLKGKDYCVVPDQPWLDGYVVEDGLIRQFVAMPLGSGFTVEEQLTGKAEFGGLQIEAIPMKRSEYERRFPKKARDPHHRMLRGMPMNSYGIAGPTSYQSMGGFDSGALYMCSVAPASAAASAGDGDRGLESSMESMGLGAGGQMKQQVFEDPYGLDQWDTGHKSRCFVHLANSMMWRRITGDEPPPTPCTASEYKRYGMPWFDFYSDAEALSGTSALKSVKTVKQVGQQKGIHALPENSSVHVEPQHIHAVASGFGKQVKDGVWK